MRTCVTLDERVVREMRDLSREKTKTSAVAAAVKQEIRRAKHKKLAGFLGRVDTDEEAITKACRRDLDRVDWLTGIDTRKRGQRH